MNTTQPTPAADALRWDFCEVSDYRREKTEFINLGARTTAATLVALGALFLTLAAIDQQLPLRAAAQLVAGCVLASWILPGAMIAALGPRRHVSCAIDDSYIFFGSMFIPLDRVAAFVVVGDEGLVCWRASTPRRLDRWLIERLSGAPDEPIHRRLRFGLPEDPGSRSDVVSRMSAAGRPVDELPEPERATLVAALDGKELRAPNTAVLRSWFEVAGMFGLTVVLGMGWGFLRIVDVVDWLSPRLFVMLPMVLGAVLGPGTWIALARYGRVGFARAQVRAEVLLVNLVAGFVGASTTLAGIPVAVTLGLYP